MYPVLFISLRSFCNLRVFYTAYTSATWKSILCKEYLAHVGSFLLLFSFSFFPQILEHLLLRYHVGCQQILVNKSQRLGVLDFKAYVFHTLKFITHFLFHTQMCGDFRLFAFREIDPQNSATLDGVPRPLGIQKTSAYLDFLVVIVLSFKTHGSSPFTYGFVNCPHSEWLPYFLRLWERVLWAVGFVRTTVCIFLVLFFLTNFTHFIIRSFFP